MKNMFWWMALPNIPNNNGNNEYIRMRKIWADKTRFRGIEIKRKHEFTTLEYETHMMTTLWENFTLFPTQYWLKDLALKSGIPNIHSESTKCNWCYGFRENATRKIADIVIGFNKDDAGLGCYVIEAKAPKGKLSEKDLDPQYYLGMKAIQENSNYRKLIYLVDEKEKARIEIIMQNNPTLYKDCGIMTWSELAGVQINLVRFLELPREVKSYIAGSIQYQYCQHNVVPTVLSENYLKNEPSQQAVEDGITSYDIHEPQWAQIR